MSFAPFMTHLLYCHQHVTICQVSEGASRVEELTKELYAERTESSQASEAGALEMNKAQELLAFKEKEVSTV